MPILLSGRKFDQDLVKYGSLAIFAPLEGGFETRLLRRMKAKGYKTMMVSARGLGDPEAFLLRLHGIRPPHLGHQSVGRNGALGEVQEVTPILNELINEKKPVALWLLEGQVLSHSELLALCDLCDKEPRLKIIVEIGGARKVHWQPMRTFLQK